MTTFLIILAWSAICCSVGAYLGRLFVSHKERRGESPGPFVRRTPRPPLPGPHQRRVVIRPTARDRTASNHLED